MKNNSKFIRVLLTVFILVFICVSVSAEAPDPEPVIQPTVPAAEATEPPEYDVPDTDWTEPPKAVDPEENTDEEPSDEEPVDGIPTEEPVEEDPTEEPTEDPTDEPTEEPTPTEEPVDEEPTEEPADENTTVEPTDEPDPTATPVPEIKVAYYSYYVDDELIAYDEYELTAVDNGYTCSVVLPKALELEGFEFAGWFIDGEEFKGGEVILPDSCEFIVTASYTEIETEVPEYKVSVFTSVDGEDSVPFGTEITVYCVLEGFENTPYTLLWQYTPDNGKTVFDIANATGESFSYILSEENAAYRYRVLVMTDD